METNNVDSDEPDGSCLICHSKTSLSNDVTTQDYFHHPLNPKLFLKDLQTYFLLKHILGISSVQLQGYLRHCPYPGDWVKVCSLCADTYVNNCSRTFLELQEARRKYRLAREKIIEAVKKSVENEPESLETFTLDICREVRRCVSQNLIEPLVVDDSTENTSSERRARRSNVRRGNLSSPTNLDGIYIGANHLKIEPPEKDSSRDGIDDDAVHDIFDDGGQDYWDDGDNFGGGEAEGDDETYVPYPSKRTTSTPIRNRRKRGRKSRTSAAATEVVEKSDNFTEYPCKICSKVFSHSDNLRKHHNECHGRIFHRCSEKGCSWKSRRSYDLKNHMRRHHGSVADLIDLTCPLCSKVFSKKSHLNYHMTHSKEHSTGPSVACEKCDKEFLDETGLKSHQAIIHNVKEFQLHVCTFENCGKGFYRKCHFVLHQASHKNIAVKCDTCDKCFKSTKRLLNHQEKHKTGGSLVSTGFKCSLCPKRFPKRVDLLRHKKLRHSPLKSKDLNPIKAEAAEDGGGGGAETTEGVDTLASTAADGEASHSDNYDEDPNDDDWNDDLGESEKDSDEEAAGVSGASTSKGKLKRVRAKSKLPKTIRRPRKPMNANPIIVNGENGEVQYRCEHEGCSKISATLRYYKIHLRAVHDPLDEEFCCHLCGKSFKRRNHLSVHIRAVHEGKKPRRRKDRADKVEDEDGPRKCDHCDMILKSKAIMQRHMQITHLRSYKFYCELCGKGMVNGADLRYHRVQYHYICAIEGCGVTCQDREEVWKHHKEVHDTEVGLFSCPECGKLFLGKRKYKVHLQLHEHKRRQQEQPAGEGGSGVIGEYVCDLCGRQFPVKDYLSHHMSYSHRGKLRGKNKRMLKEESNGGGEGESLAVKEEN